MSTISRARELRVWMTEAEKILWRQLRRGKADGWHFRRQYPIDQFFADFCCVKARLIIELDGDCHEEPDARAYDDWRQVQIQSMGWKVMRFKNEEVLADPGLVRAKILAAIGF